MSFNAFGAKIKVIGVGGGGGNAVNTMIRSGLEGVDFIVANTDSQAIKASLAPHKIQLGKDLTKGLGAGADPDIGRDAALEDRAELQEFLSDADMVFITAGMGGGTGTGAAAVVAQIARELGALTVAVVTKPFAFEGKRRRKHAEQGIARLRECVDTLITIPNQRLLQVATPDLSMLDAFKLADNVLVNAVRGISDIINTPGLINVDFADVKTVMSSMGHALMGIGYGSGPERSLLAAKQAISSPLLEDVDIEGATGILINITAGTNVSIMEVNNACMVIQEAAHEDANIIFGAVIDETLGDEIRITVIATGFPVEDSHTTEDTFGTKSLIGQQGRGYGQTSTLPQRLVSPPRLTSQRPTQVSQPLPSSQASAPIQSAYVQRTQSQATIRPPETDMRQITSQTTPPSPASSLGAIPVTRHENHATTPNVNMNKVDVASEAAALAHWTLEDHGPSSTEPQQDLSGIEIKRCESPGTPVFNPPELKAPGGQKTVAELVFVEEEAAIPSSNETLAPADSWDQVSPPEIMDRAGAMLAPLATSDWEFDAPNPELVSHEIDRRIDEALALAGKMGLGSSEPSKGRTVDERISGLELDDLDLPAFLRIGSDVRQGG